MSVTRASSENKQRVCEWERVSLILLKDREGHEVEAQPRLFPPLDPILGPLIHALRLATKPKEQTKHHPLNYLHP